MNTLKATKIKHLDSVADPVFKDLIWLIFTSNENKHNVSVYKNSILLFL